MQEVAYASLLSNRRSSLHSLIVAHAESEIELYFGFYGIYGFVCCVFLVLAAKELRKLLMRDEDYYESD